MNYKRAIAVGRAAKSMTQKDLAEKAGLDCSYISMIESGLRTPGPSAEKRVAEALGMSVELLVLVGAENKADLEAATRNKPVQMMASDLLELILGFDQRDVKF